VRHCHRAVGATVAAAAAALVVVLAGCTTAAPPTSGVGGDTAGRVADRPATC
jgi:hypothetical protein